MNANISIRHYSPIVDAAYAVDETIQQPVAIRLHASGRAFASYEGAEDVSYRNLDCLLNAHTLDADHMVHWLVSVDRESDAQLVACATVEEIRERVEPREIMKKLAIKLTL